MAASMENGRVVVDGPTFGLAIADAALDLLAVWRDDFGHRQKLAKDVVVHGAQGGATRCDLDWIDDNRSVDRAEHAHQGSGHIGVGDHAYLDGPDRHGIEQACQLLSHNIGGNW